MQFSRAILAAVSFALVAAQSRLSFTTLPSEVEAGKGTELKWTGGDGSPVTITLRKGESDDLQTIAVITGNAEGNSFTWTPSESLANGDDYALEISQGVDESNYTGLFSLSGGSDEETSSASGYPTGSAPASVSASSTRSASASTAETTVTSANSTTTASHTTYLVGTAPSASGTGVSVSRNTTFSSATPTRSRSGGLIASTTGASSTEDSTASETSSAAETSSSAAGAAGLQVQVGAGLAAVLGLAAML